MSCRRKGRQTSSFYVRPVKGGEVSTVVGMSYVKLANSFECTHSPIKLNPANEPSLIVEDSWGLHIRASETPVEGLLQTAGTHGCILLPRRTNEGDHCMNTRQDEDT